MKYRAMIYNGAKNFTMEERNLPVCGDNDIIVKNLVASICGSDSDTWLNGGQLHLIPSHEELGHEVVSEVVQVGKNVVGLKPGDRIAPLPGAFTPNPMKSGYLGGFSEYIYGTNAQDGVTLFKLDDKLSDKEAALIEPVAVSVNAADHARVTENSKIIVLGAGIIGFGIAARLAQRGVPKENIVFVEQSALRLSVVENAGFRGVNTGNANWKDQMFSITGTTYGMKGIVSNADVIFDAAGSIDPDETEPTLLERSFAWAKYGCKIYVVGVHRQKVHVPVTDFVFCCYDLKSVGGASAESFRSAIELLGSQIVDFKKTVTQTFPFSEIIEAIKFSCNRDACMKVQIDYRL